MSTCYKCGRELTGTLTECEYSCFPDDEEIEESGREWAEENLEVDWSKVKTLEQVIAILSASDMPIYFNKDSAEAKKFREFLRPIKLASANEDEED